MQSPDSWVETFFTVKQGKKMQNRMRKKKRKRKEIANERQEEKSEIARWLDQRAKRKNIRVNQCKMESMLGRVEAEKKAEKKAENKFSAPQLWSECTMIQNNS